jgi:hypothetical protein
MTFPKAVRLEWTTPRTADIFDKITVMVARPDRIVVAIAIADGGPAWPRCGGAPLR